MRCRACNAILEPAEIIWIEERGDHEDLCRNCRNAIAFEDSDVVVSYYEDAFDYGDGPSE